MGSRVMASVAEQVQSSMMNKSSRPPLASEGRTIVATESYCCLSTISSDSGFPTASEVGFVASPTDGTAFLALSSMSSHTKDVENDNRVSIMCVNGSLSHADESRITISGHLTKVTDEQEHRSARELYLSKHPEAFWIDFGDFSFYKLYDITTARVVAGFGSAGSLSPDEYANAEIDPIAQYSAPIAKHMNDDHAESTKKMVRHFCGYDADSADFICVDSYGFDARAYLSEESFRFRVGFYERVTDRKAVKDQIVELSKEADQQLKQQEEGQ